MPEDKLDFKRILPVFVIVLIDLLGLTIILPLLPHYSVSFGASPRVYGLLAAAYPVMQFLAAPVLGRLSDRYGRKPVLLISQMGTFVGFMMLGFAGGLPLLFAARIVDGLSGGNISTAQAVITDSTTEKTRTQGLGLIGAAFGLGFTIGPVIAFISLRLSDSNYAVPAFVAAAMSLISIVLTAVWLKETAPAKTGGAPQSSKMSAFSFRAMVSALGHPAVGVLLGLIFFQQLARGSLENMIGLFTLSRLGMSGGDNAALFVFLGVIIVAVQGYFIGRWSRALGDRKLIYLGLGLLSLGLLLAAATPRVPIPWYDEAELRSQLTADDDSFRTHEPPQAQGLEVDLPPGERTGWLGLGWLMVALVPAAVGGGVLYPSLNSLITKRVEPHEIGGMLGVSASLFSAGNALAPVVGGALFDWLGSSAPFAAGGLLIAVMLVAALRAITPGREEAVQPGLAPGGAN